MSESIIDKAYEDNASLLAYLAERKELSFLRTADDSFRKNLVLSAASLFEHQISEALHSYCDRKSGSNACILALVRNKALKRQYHSYFDWENKRAGTFFSLLGEDIGERLRAASKADPLKTSIEAFLELGSMRNSLVHQNFAGFAFDKTNEEVYRLYRLAAEFVDRVIEALS